MELTFTNDEVCDVIKYMRLEQYHPCNDCPDKSYCCGCPKSRAFNERLKEIEPPKQLMECKVLVEYAKTEIDLENLYWKMESLRNKQAALYDRKDELQKHFKTIMK